MTTTEDMDRIALMHTRLAQLARRSRRSAAMRTASRLVRAKAAAADMIAAVGRRVPSTALLAAAAGALALSAGAWA
jgi:hypothetical protein